MKTKQACFAVRKVTGKRSKAIKILFHISLVLLLTSQISCGSRHAKVVPNRQLDTSHREALTPTSFVINICRYLYNKKEGRLDVMPFVTRETKLLQLIVNVDS